jgi:hypothetical protein
LADAFGKSSHPFVSVRSVRSVSFNIVNALHRGTRQERQQPLGLALRMGKTEKNGFNGFNGKSRTETVTLPRYDTGFSDFSRAALNSASAFNVGVTGEVSSVCAN